MINELKSKPITLDEDKISRLKSLYQTPINQKDPRYSEKLVKLDKFKVAEHSFYYSNNNPPYHHSVPGALEIIYLRESVAKKLQSINKKIQKFGLELLVFDAYRPIAVQNYFYYDWVPKQLRAKHPEADEDWIELQTSRYWSKGASNKEELLKHIPPHSTGGAIDLTLRFIESKIPLEMGSIFDDISKKSHANHFEKSCDPESYTENEARDNRRLLHYLMAEEGFCAHPFEWWHFSFGDQMWGFLKDERPFYSYAGDQLSLDFQK